VIPGDVGDVLRLLLVDTRRQQLRLAAARGTCFGVRYLLLEIAEQGH
jgi:hypothetical protein